METVTVALGSRAYPIYIGQDLLGDMALVSPVISASKVAIVTNTTVGPLYLERLSAAFRNAGVHVVEVVLPDGEQYKSWQTLNTIFDVLLENRCERSTTLIALGGGVIGDMTGFAAACYQRGMPFVQVPTTLLSQVDSSVGGKTAINHPLGKNMIGAFKQPRLVLADTALLKTLPDRELRSGLAEIIKIGLIRDSDFFLWLEANLGRLLGKDAEALEFAICRACSNKADVVVADEHEHGERALLNLGHTFGHAIEAGTGYGTWLHGEAVAAGTMMAAELSRMLGWIDSVTVERIQNIFARAGLPTSGALMEDLRYLELMQHDKKVIDGKMRLVLLERIGKAVVSEVATASQIAQAIRLRSGNV